MKKLQFHGKRIDVYTLESGKDLVSHPGAAVVLPLLDPETILLIRNERECVNDTLLELPAGTLEPNEEPHLCAARELEEETGYKASTLTPLLNFYTTPGFCNERIYAFLATDLTPTRQNLDPSENITVEATPITTALSLIKEGAIIDAKTIATILFHTT